MIPEPHRAALRKIVSRLEGCGILWALTGSMSFAVRGLPFTPNDIDLQTDAAGAYALGRLLQSVETRPVFFSQKGNVRSHIGAYEIEGVEVEIIGDIEKRLPSGEWTAPPDLAAHLRFVEWEGLRVPVLSLEYEAEAYRQLGREERAIELAAFCQAPSRV